GLSKLRPLSTLQLQAERLVVLLLQEEDTGIGCDGPGEISANQRPHGRRARVPLGSEPDHIVRWGKAKGSPGSLHYQGCDPLSGGRALRQSGSSAEGEVSCQSQDPAEAVQHHD